MLTKAWPFCLLNVSQYIKKYFKKKGACHGFNFTEKGGLKGKSGMETSD